MRSWSLRGKSANLAVALLACALLGSAPAGGVYVTSLPAGADVWADGTYLGRSPLLLDALEAGSHQLTLTRTGWAAQDVSIVVVPGTTTAASVVLVHEGRGAEPGGWIAVHGASVGSAVIDGESKSLANGMVGVSAGVHEVSIAASGGRLTRSVTVYPQMRTDVVFNASAPRRSVVIAPADDYLPADAYTLSGTQLTMHYRHHDVSGRVGSATYTVDRHVMTSDAAPTMIKNRLYLPIDLLTLLAADDH